MERSSYPRLLVISHNCFSKTKNNGKTLASIFEGWPNEKIAQLYFYNELPDASVCKDFFRITDESMLRNRRGFTGDRIKGSYPEKSAANNAQGKNSWIRKYRNLAVFGFLRNVLWSSGKWSSENLWKWLDEFKPEVVFLVGGDSVFSYKIAQKISERFLSPLFLYYTDDYVTPRFTFDPFWWINLLWLWRSLKNILPQVSRVFVIGEDMAEEYEEKLGKKCAPIMNSVDVEKFNIIGASAESKKESDEAIRFAYFGGLHLSRWKSLIRLGEAIESVTERARINASLSIYSTSSPNKRMMNRIKELRPYVRFAGSVDEKGIIAEMMKYDVLVHAESFDRTNRQKTRLSISTKIPEYLATGKPIFAIGPGEISSIRYLRQNEAGIVVDTANEEKLKMAIIEVFKNYDKYTESGKNNRILAEQNHDLNRVRELIRQELTENS